VKGNLIHKNIKIMKEDSIEDFKNLDLNTSPQGKTPFGYQGVSVIDEDFNKLIENPKEVGKKYEKIQNGRDYMFYHRNVSALIKKTNGIMIDLFRKHILSISNDLFYKLMYILHTASNLLMKNLMMICKARFIENDDLSKDFFESSEFEQIRKELDEDLKGSDLEMKMTEEMMNETIQKWMNNDDAIIKNIEFISLVKDDNKKEISGYFKDLYENTVKEFLMEQYDLLKEDLIEDKDALILLRYMQICCNIDNIYKILQRISGEDNSHLFFSLHDFLDNASKEELKSLLKAAMNKNK